MTTRGAVVVAAVDACAALCVCAALASSSCATTSSAAADPLAGKPHVAKVLQTVPAMQDILGGCSIDKVLRDHRWARAFDCGEFVVETQEVDPNPAPAPNPYRDPPLIVDDVVDVATPSATFSIARAKKHVPTLYVLRFQARTIRCSAGLQHATDDVEERCLGAIVAFASSMGTEAVEASADSRPPPAKLPNDCVPLDGGKSAHGAAGARCGDTLLTWRAIGHDDADVAADSADEPYLGGQRDVRRSVDARQCHVAGQLGRCTHTTFRGGAILHAVASVDGQRLLVTCMWAGGEGDVPKPCYALVEVD